MATDDLDRVCAVLTGIFEKMKNRKDEGQALIVGMTPDGKFNLTTIIIGVPGTSNRDQMGFLVNALREQDQESNYAAVGMALDVTFSDQTTGRKADALYVRLENRDGAAQDVVFPYKKKLLGGFRLDKPQLKVTEPRVYGPKGDELVALVKNKIKHTNQPEK